MSSISKLAIWRDRYWSDISSQLLRLNTIDETHFDGLLLKKDTANGAWLWNWLGRVYNQHSNTARETATVEVVAPAQGAGGVWMLKLEVMVRRHQTRSFATFPLAFELRGCNALLGAEPGAEGTASSASRG